MAILAHAIKGHSQTLEKLEGLIKSSTLPKCLIFSGPSGIGKKQVALALSQHLVCEKGVLACGSCGACQRLELLKSESLMMLSPENDMIRIDEVKKILPFLELKQSGRSRIVIIENPESLNLFAANALLKTLEEPPDQTYFFLISSSPWKVLPTIKSRSITIQFSSLADSDLKALLPELADWTLAAAQGQVDKALNVQQWDQEGYRQDAFYVFRSLFENKIRSPDDRIHQSFHNKAAQVALLECLLSLTRDALVLKLGHTPLKTFNPDFEEQIKKQEIKTSHLSIIFQELLITEKYFKQNVDRALALEHFYIKAAYAN